MRDHTLRWLLPAEFAADSAGETVPRTPRDWAVDILAFGGAVLLGLVVLGIAMRYETISQGLQTLDVALGALAFLSLWWRRRACLRGRRSRPSCSCPAIGMKGWPMWRSPSPFT